MNVDFLEACGKNQKEGKTPEKKCKKRHKHGTNKRRFKTEREMGKEKTKKKRQKNDKEKCNTSRHQYRQ